MKLKDYDQLSEEHSLLGIFDWNKCRNTCSWVVLNHRSRIRSNQIYPPPPIINLNHKGMRIYLTLGQLLGGMHVYLLLVAEWKEDLTTWLDQPYFVLVS